MVLADERQIFEAIKRNDNGAYEKIFRAYYRPMTAYAFRFLGNLPESESVVQDVFLRLWQNRTEIMITSSLMHYLFRSVKNHCINFLEHERIKSRYQAFVIQNETDRNDYREFFPEPDLMNRIEAAISALPPKRQEIFRLAREEGLKYREIAERLELSVKTIETQMSLALKQLRESLKVLKHLVLFFMRSIKGKG
ncbi:MAG: RNA polymerase sigma-70 factor [Mariniphaga sp.]